LYKQVQLPELILISGKPIIKTLATIIRNIYTIVRPCDALYCKMSEWFGSAQPKVCRNLEN